MSRPSSRTAATGRPKRFAIAQPPNPPLIAFFVAEIVRRATHGDARRYARAVGDVALSVWAYDETLHGTNWFRRLVGVAALWQVFVRLTKHSQPK